MSFNFDLPVELIAERPAARGQSRLLIGSTSGKIIDESFSNLAQYVSPGTLMILNDTKVISCRFFPPEIPHSEIFLVKENAPNRFEVMFKRKKEFKLGRKFRLSKSLLGEVVSDGEIFITSENSTESVESLIDKEGRIPIPPYIRDGVSDETDFENYQTVFAKNPGSVAAPTASLHFSTELLTELEMNGVEIRYLTLHVGLHSILSTSRQLEAGKVGLEEFIVPGETLKAIGQAKSEDRPVLAVGTTVTRALESLTDKELSGEYDPKFRSTDLFIQPGFKFRVIDRLMTNFHLCGSTHLGLVSAFYGEDRLKRVYQHAVGERYRFYSYGDSMLLGV